MRGWPPRANNAHATDGHRSSWTDCSTKHISSSTCVRTNLPSGSQQLLYFKTQQDKKEVHSLKAPRPRPGHSLARRAFWCFTVVKKNNIELEGQKTEDFAPKSRANQYHPAQPNWHHRWVLHLSAFRNKEHQADAFAAKLVREQ